MVCPTCQQLNPPGARFCNNCGAALEGAGVAGDRRLVTIMFADVVGSTTWAERVDPEEWTEIMDGAMRFMIQGVTRYEGTVARLMGDGLLALFGAPVSHEDDAERAVLAALAIRDAAADYSAALEPRYGTAFAVRVGVNTGLSVLTRVGDETKAEYTAMGDSANLAARLQALAPPQGIVIGPETHALVRHAFEMRPRGAETIRGRSGSVSAYDVIAPKGGGGKARGLEGVASPFVGREEELAALTAAVRRAEAGRPGVLLVVGEAGLGKSRLLAELKAREPAVTWLEGRAISYARTSPYHPWRQPLIDSLRPGPGLADAEVVRLLSELHSAPGERGHAAALAGSAPGQGGRAPDESGRERPAWFRALAALLGVEGAAGEFGEPREAAAQIAAGVRAHLARLGRDRPVVLVLEDIHWADHASTDLLENLARQLDNERVLLVGAMRPDRDSGAWGLLERVAAHEFDTATADVDVIHVTPLDHAMAEHLLDDLLDMSGMPAATRRTILEKSEGNPFYLEEVIRSLIDSGHIVNQGGRWLVQGEITAVAVPDTLAGVLGARIDRLPEEERQVAQTASVIGREFATRLLRAVLREPARGASPELESQLGSLTQEGLLSQVAVTRFADYRFKHEFTRDAAYERLLLRRRRELHGRIGEAMEELFGDHREIAKDLAHHYRLGERWLEAARWSLAAARSARRLNVPADAQELAQAALDALGRLDGPADGAAMALHAEVLGELVTLGMQMRQHEDPALRPRLVERGERAVELSREVGDRRALVVSLVNLGNVHVLSGFPGTGFDWLMEAHDLARDLGDDKLFLAPLWVATEIMLDDTPLVAVRQLDQVIEMARRVGNRHIEAHALGTKTAALARLGEFEAALEVAPQALSAAEGSDSVIKRADVNLLVGLAYLEMGDVQPGIEHLTHGTDLALSVNGFECACNGLYMLGLGHLRDERIDEAVRDLLRSIETASGTVMEGALHNVRASLASARFRSGDRAAVAAIEREIANAEAHSDGFGVVRARLDLAEALLTEGQGERAADHLRQVVEWVEERQMWPYAHTAHKLLSEALAQAGDADGSAAAARRALEVKGRIHWPQRRPAPLLLPAPARPAPAADRGGA